MTLPYRPAPRRYPLAARLPEESMATQAAAAFERLRFIEQVYVAAMLVRWNPDWGKPSIRLGPITWGSPWPQRGPECTTIKLTSNLCGLGLLGGDQCLVTVDEVRPQVDELLELLEASSLDVASES